MEGIENTIDEIACTVLDGDCLKEFLELDLEDKIIELWALAYMVKDGRVTRYCKVALKLVKVMRSLGVLSK